MLNALSTVLADALPRAHGGYLLGLPDELEIVDTAINEHGAVRINSASDLIEKTDVIVAGPEWESVYSGSEFETFVERFAHLNSFLKPGGFLVVVLNNAHNIASLLTPTLVRQRWDVDGVQYDPTRPGSPAQILTTLTAAGHSAATVHEVFGGADRWCVISHEAEALATRFDTIREAVSDSIAHADGASLIPSDLFVDRLAGAGALYSAASSYIAVVGGRSRSLYLGHDESVWWLDGSAQDARWAVGGAPASQLGVTQVPVTHSLATLLFKDIAAGDTGRFRMHVQRAANWIRKTSDLDGMGEIDFRDIYPTGDTFDLGIPISRPRVGQNEDDHTVSRNQLLTSSWRKFANLARSREAELPWPATFSEDELVRIWLSMSGVAEDEAEQLIGSIPSVPNQDDSPYRSAVDEAQLTSQAQALHDEIVALQSTLDERDEELAIRARAIRSLRRQVLSATTDRAKMAKANQDIKRSQAFRLANQFRRAALITRPKKLARALGKRADARVRQLRRAG